MRIKLLLIIASMIFEMLIPEFDTYDNIVKSFKKCMKSLSTLLFSILGAYLCVAEK